MTLDLLSPEEGQRLIKQYMVKAVSYKFGMLSNGEPVFMLKDSEPLAINPDDSVTWDVRELGISLHSFIELITGETKKKTVYLLLCLVNPATRQNLKPLLYSTVDGVDGRFNNKDAEFWILYPNIACCIFLKPWIKLCVKTDCPKESQRKVV